MSLKSPNANNKDTNTENDNEIPVRTNAAEQSPDQPGAEEETTSSDALSEEKHWQEEAKKFEDLYLRSNADLVNVKKRLEREKDSVIKFANENLAKDLLPVLDNIERALDHADTDDSGQEGILEGIRLMQQSLKSVLEKYSVTQVTALGQKFDPGFHEAVMQEEDPDADDGTVLKEIQKGYLLKDRLIRPAMVVVSKRPAIDKD
jgi:molecular chaperone GrpE